MQMGVTKSADGRDWYRYTMHYARTKPQGHRCEDACVAPCGVRRRFCVANSKLGKKEKLFPKLRISVFGPKEVDTPQLSLSCPTLDFLSHPRATPPPFTSEFRSHRRTAPAVAFRRACARERHVAPPVPGVASTAQACFWLTPLAPSAPRPVPSARPCGVSRPASAGVQPRPGATTHPGCR